MQTVIEVEGLLKRYGDFEAVGGISFQVEKGEIFGLLGENGAGKTTTLEVVEGLRVPSAGKVRVLGYEMPREAAAMKQRIGVQLQSSSYYHYLTLREILTLFASFYDCQVGADQLLASVRLEQKANSYVASLSGGQRQRFSVVSSLVNDPEIVFLDEPTTGLDPVARRNLWELIEAIRQQGKTVVLTTHYLEEAELLCDCIAIMDRGKIIAQDKTSRLVERAAFPYTLLFEPTANQEKVVAALAKQGELSRRPGKRDQYEVRLKNGVDLGQILDLVRQAKPEGLSIRPASLEDVFIELTGKTLTEEEHD